MRNNTPLVVFAAFCCLAGCNAQPSASPAGADASSGGWIWHDLNELNSKAENVGVTASWGTWNKKLVYLILTDAKISGQTNINSSRARTEYQVDLTTPTGGKTGMRIETADGTTGGVTYGGQSFDLARGSVFVLLPKGDEFEVRQLKRDFSDGKAVFGNVVKLLQDDQEIAGLLAKKK